MSASCIELRKRFGEDGWVLLQSYRPEVQVAVSRDVERAHLGNAPTLRVVAGSYSDRLAEMWVELQLNDLSEFAGCRGKLSPAQVAELARIIIQTYGHLRLTELMLFFQRFKRCEYGHFYGTVDPMVIMGALREFAGQRVAVLDTVRQRREREEKRREEAAYAEVQNEYRRRVPGAYTPEAALTFMEYRRGGYRNMTDEQLAEAIAEKLAK